MTSPIQRLMKKLFDGGNVEPPTKRRRLETSHHMTTPSSPFKACYTLSKSPTKENISSESTKIIKEAPAKAPAKSFLDETSFHHIYSIAHGEILLCLGPHEILSLWRTSKSIWNSLTVSRRWLILLRSSFAYLRISDEAAEHVTKTIPGGWNEFLPLIVRMCEDLAHTYGHLEPDVAHRAFVAEQACFVNGRFGYGRLASHELLVGRGRLPIYDENGNFSETLYEKKSVTFDHLKSATSYQVCWGDVDSCLGGVDEDGEMKRWLERSRAWMQEHSDKAPNIHYKKRLEKGLHPSLWIMFDTGAERLEYTLGIGPNLEQFVNFFSSHSDLSDYERQRERQTETFWSCFDENYGSWIGGFVEFLVSYPCAKEQLYDPQPSLNMAIWCMRHGIEPFTDKSIDWVDLIRDGKSLDSLDEKSKFLVEALTLPTFGPACKLQS